MTANHVYDHGLPFSESLATEVIIPIINIKRGIGLILVGGRPGTGKTTLGVEIADFIEKRKIDLDPENHPQLSMGYKPLIPNALICHRQKRRVIVYDEAGDFSKKATLTKASREIQQFFERCRALGLHMVLVCPNPLEIDGSLFKIPGLIQGLIFIDGSSDHDSTYGVYDADGIGWLKYYASKWPYHPHMPYKLCKPYMRGKFLNLEPKRAEQLSIISTGDKIASMRKMGRKKRERIKVAA